MRISKPPEERRNEILDAAEKLFVTRGYGKTTVNDVINAIGVAKGTFYYYFKSKEDVMRAIVMRILDQIVSRARTIADDPTLNAAEKLFNVIAASGHENKDELLEEFHDIGNAEMHLMSIEQAILHITPVLTDIVEQGKREGIFTTQHPTEAIEVLLVSSQFLFDEGIFKWEPETLAHKAKVFAEIMEILLGAEKGTFTYIYKRFAGLD